MTVKILDAGGGIRLSDLHPVQGDKQSIDDDSLCSVEEVGFKRIVRGPTRTAVDAKVEEMIRFGATPIGDIEEIDGQWVAMCDTAGIQNTGFRW